MAACPWELMLLGVSWKLLGAVLLVQQGLLMSITALLPICCQKCKHFCRSSLGAPVSPGAT